MENSRSDICLTFSSRRTQCVHHDIMRISYRGGVCARHSSFVALQTSIRSNEIISLFPTDNISVVRMYEVLITTELSLLPMAAAILVFPR